MILKSELSTTHIVTKDMVDPTTQQKPKDPFITIIKSLDLSPAWLAAQCGFKRTAVSNWLVNPDKYPIPADKREIIIHRLHKVGKALTAIH